MKTIDDFVEWFNNGEWQALTTFDCDSYCHAISQAVRSSFYGQKEREYIGASIIGGTPLLQLALKKLGFPSVSSDSLKVKTMMIFHLGHLFETLVTHLMRAYGLSVDDSQLEVKYSELFKGHIDLIVNGSTLVEVKTMVSDYWEDFTAKPNNFRGYYTQLAFYYYGLEDRLTDCGWLCFNKNTFDLAFVRPSMEQLKAEFCLAKEKMYYLSKCSSLDDLFDIGLPELREEVYKGKPTGRYLLPHSLARSPYRECFYNIYEARDGYGKLKKYVDVDNPPSKETIIERLLKKREEVIRNLKTQNEPFSTEVEF